MAYGARLESVLGETPQGFKSPILRHSDGPRIAKASGGLLMSSATEAQENVWLPVIRIETNPAPPEAWGAESDRSGRPSA